jgi:hypothetical protein
MSILNFRTAIPLLVFALTAISIATPAQARILLGSSNNSSLSNGLVGYWPLDGAVTNWNTGTTLDLSGSGNTGSLVSLSTTSSPVAGKIGQALYLLNGGAVEAPFSASLKNQKSDCFRVD